ncbi:hypothetical protein ACFLUA_03060 [Chloroflexota bacterium]
MVLLNDGVHRKLIFISVPARFYITTLIGEWIGNIRKDHEKGDQTDRIAWLWLKEGDYAPARFPAYVIAALNRVESIETLVGMMIDRCQQICSCQD